MQSYPICATQRSVSTLLCEIGKSTRLAGYPEEYFDTLKDTGVPRRPLEYFTGVTDEALLNILKDRNHLHEEQCQPLPGRSDIIELEALYGQNRIVANGGKVLRDMFFTDQDCMIASLLHRLLLGTRCEIGQFSSFSTTVAYASLSGFRDRPEHTS